MAIAIIGAGLVSCLGGNLLDAWKATLDGKDGLRPIERFPADDFSQKLAGMLPPELEQKLRADHGDEDLAQSMILQAAAEAMGGIPPEGDTGLILGTNFGLMETREWCWRERLDTGSMDLGTFSRQQSIVDTVATRLGLQGPRVQLSLSCASGAGAVALAWQWLSANRCRRVLVICYDAITEFCWCGLSNLRTITTDRIRPFNKDRQGTIFSEGAAAMLLSVADSERALGFLAGAATNNNAFHMTAPCKEAEGSRRVMAEALRCASVTPEEIDLVCAHATGTAANDVTEAAAICNLLGNRPVPVTAFKANLGHMMGGAGLAEILLTLQALRNGIVPFMPNTKDPDPECKVELTFSPGRTGLLRTAVTNSAGIGGNNSAVVLFREKPVRTLSFPNRAVKCRALSWVLPGLAGAGAVPPECDPGQLAGRNSELESLPIKDYIQSVKGYLDPHSIFTLAAASLCLKQGRPTDPARTAVLTATQYGAPGSGYKFFEQMASKGHRFASPLIFPHSYSNTAGNLVAIEFGLAGPHLVFDLATDLSEAWWAAVDLLRRGLADDALVIATEGAPAATLPDGTNLLHGAIALYLTVDQQQPDLKLPPLARQGENRQGVVFATLRSLRAGQ